jgi:hypothetical protein
MSSRRVPTKRYIVTAHPYAFDAFFAPGNRWTGLGQVTVHSIGGGVNQAQALVEADDQGCLALKASGFTIQRLRKELSPSEDTVVIKKSKAARVGG